MFGRKKREQEEGRRAAEARAAEEERVRAAEEARVRAAEEARAAAISAAYDKVCAARREHAEAKRLYGLYADGPKKAEAAARMNRAADALLAAEAAHDAALRR